MFLKLTRNSTMNFLPVEYVGLSSVPEGKEENFEELQKIWKREKMQYFKDYLKWYNNKDVVPTLEALQKILLLPFPKHWYVETGFDAT